MLLDSVASQLLEADVIEHVKRTLTASNAVVELLYNTLMLVKSLSASGQFRSLDQTLLRWPALGNKAVEDHQ